jgi:hypothetical protein
VLLSVVLQDLYVAVTKATLPDEVVPKEKHVRSELQLQASRHDSRAIWVLVGRQICL